MSDLIAHATDLYDAWEMDSLPVALRRNSLDYYYLSIYPSLAEMRPLADGDDPAYPDVVNNVYIHIPFCSGVCEFCSYYLVAVGPAARGRIDHYLDLARRELDYHAARTTLDLTYIFFGGGTPSLISAESLGGFLDYMERRGWLGAARLGTLELHPEFFSDARQAARFLDVLRHYGISRVSVGYQVSDEHLLSATKRRHHASFINDAMELLRSRDLCVNLDLMYGLAGQSLESWEATLRDADRLAADSLSTYFLFVDPGTVTYKKVHDGRIVLPDHRHVQTLHIMAQQLLGERGYWELPSDFYARGVVDAATFRPDHLPSQRDTLPIGPGAYGYYGQTQLANVFDLGDYERRMRAGRPPLWRGYKLDARQSFHRDVMFSFKNDPFLDCSLFVDHYNWNPLDEFAETFAHLAALRLVEVDGQQVRLTPKGRLCVEEISCLFRDPTIAPNAHEATADQVILQRHNFAPTYPVVKWTD